MNTAKIPTPCRDQEENGPKNGPYLEHKFLFVNESTPIRGFKAGRRPEVHSHIRRHVMNNYKKDQLKSKQNVTKIQRLSPLRSADQRLNSTEGQDEIHWLNDDIGVKEVVAGLDANGQTQFESKNLDHTNILPPETYLFSAGRRCGSTLDFAQSNHIAEHSQICCLNCDTHNVSNNAELNQHAQNLIQRKTEDFVVV